MRRAASWPSFSSSRSADRSSSILQAIPLHQIGQRHRATPPGAKIGKPLFGKVDILKIAEMFEDRLAGVKAFAPPGWSAPLKLVLPDREF